MSESVDLNALRNRVLSNQRNGNDFPSNPNQGVYVNREGQLSLNPQGTGGLSQVPGKTFAY